MRSSQLQRPVARFNKSKSKPKPTNGGSMAKPSAEDRVNAFLSELSTTPIMTKPTKKINYSSKTLMLHTRHKSHNKENKKPNTTHMTQRNHHTLHRSKQQKSHHKSVQNVVQQRKTSISRPMYNALGAQPNNMYNNNRNRMLNNNSRSISPPPNQNKIDQYSLSLQIKNSECEVLKNENKELKNENMELTHTNKQLNEVQKALEVEKQNIFHLRQAFANKEERILKLETKLEGCGIDPIALKAPQFMNEDIQKNIIFWRERLCKARERLNDRKLKQKQIIQTANYYIQRLERP